MGANDALSGTPLVYAGRELMHSILSLSMATSLDEGLVTSTSAGFLCM